MGWVGVGGGPWLRTLPLPLLRSATRKTTHKSDVLPRGPVWCALQREDMLTEEVNPYPDHHAPPCSPPQQG